MDGHQKPDKVKSGYQYEDYPTGEPIDWQSVAGKMTIFFVILLEITNLSYLTRVGMDVITVFRDMVDLPLISLMFPDLSVADILAFLQALIIVFVPAAVFSGALKAGIQYQPRRLYLDPRIRPHVIIGVLLLVGIFGLELSNIRTAAEATTLLGQCDPKDIFCDMAQRAREIKAAKHDLANSKQIAVLTSLLNFAVGFALATIIHKQST